MATAQRTTPADSRVESATLVAGTVLVAVSLWLFGGGLTGLVVGAAVGFAAAASASYYGVGLAHLAALLTTSSPNLAGVVILELGSVTYLSAEVAPESRRRDVALLAALSGVALAAVTALATVYNAVIAAAALACATALVGYALHRYGLWKLGVLSEEST
jgi:FtsH-binding integral membrane protein